MLLVPSLRIGISASAIFEFACFESVKLKIHNSDVTCNQYHGLGWHQFRMAFHQTKRKLQLADTCSSELTFVMCGGEGVELRANRPTTDPSPKSPSQTKPVPGRRPRCFVSRFFVVFVNTRSCISAHKKSVSRPD